MSTAVTLRVSLQLWVLMCVLLVNTCGAPVTCEAGTHPIGQPAAVTCHFRSDVSDSGRSFNMARYPSDSEKGEIGTDVLVCHWNNQRHDCIVSEGYQFNGNMTDRVTVTIPVTTRRYAGLYMCFFVPSDGRDSHACEFFTTEVRPLDVTSGEEPPEPQGDPKSWPLTIAVPVSVIVCLTLFCLLVVCLWRRRKAKRRVLVNVDEEMPMIQANDWRDKQIKTRLDRFDLSKKALKDLMNIIDREISKANRHSPRTEGDIRIQPIHRPYLHNDTNARMLLLETSSTRLKLLEVSLGVKDTIVNFRNVTVPSEVEKRAEKKRHDFIASAAKDFVRDHKMSAETLRTVIIFPRDDTVDLGELRELLAQSLPTEKPPKILIMGTSILHTLISVSHQHPQCRLALDLGSGLNACYLNRLRGSNEDKQVAEVVYVTELGGLGEKCSIDFLRTDFDKEVDASSSLPGNVLDKMVSWTDLGQLVTVVLRRLRADDLFFSSTPLDCGLFRQDSLQADQVVEILGDRSEERSVTSGILRGLGVQDCALKELQLVQQVAKLITQRAAWLTAAALATLINRLNQPGLVIVLDGELYRRVPDFFNLMSSKTRELVKSRLQGKFHFVSPFAGGYIGAARMAAAAHSLHEKTDLAENSDTAGNDTGTPADTTDTTGKNTDTTGNNTNTTGKNTDTTKNNKNIDRNSTHTVNNTPKTENNTTKTGDDTGIIGNNTNTENNTHKTGNDIGTVGNNTNTENNTHKTGNDTGTVEC